MKRVVLIRSNPVSPDPPVEKMANTLLGYGYSVTIIGWDRDRNYKEDVKTINFANGKAVLVLFGIEAKFGAGLKGNLKPLIIFQLRVRNWIRKNIDKIDIVHAFDFDTGFISKISLTREKKFVYHILDYYIDSHDLSGLLGQIIRKKENRLIESADATIICTEKRKEQINGCIPKKLFVIHNTPDLEYLHKNISVKKSCENSKIKIVYVGILVGSRLLKELAEFIATDDRFEFHVGGFGNLEDFFEEYSKKYKNIYYYGKLPYEKTIALESECDIMVAIYNPAIKNNRYAAPNKFYESLMIGKPLIMANGTGFDDIINKNKIGCIIDFSKDGIKNGLEYMLKHRNEWVLMSKKSKELYNEQYSWNIMKERIEDLYFNL